MKASNYSGWKDVFSFTFVQTTKNKAFRVSLVLFVLIILVALPVVSYIQSTQDLNEPSPIQIVYVNNQTALPDLLFPGLQEDPLLGHIRFVTIDEDATSITERITITETDSVMLTLSDTDGLYALELVRSGKGVVKEKNMAILEEAIREQFQSILTQALGVSEEQSSIINAEVFSVVSHADSRGKIVVDEDTSISSNEYWYMYGILFVILMITMFSSSMIATSIVTEKTSRMVEYMLVSVKPLALMIGKILATISAFLIQVFALVISLIVSNALSGLFSADGSTLLSTLIPENVFQHINPINLILCILTGLVGMIFYATLAALSGATISKMEEMGEGLMLFTFTSLIGCYIALGAANVLMISGNNSFVLFATLFPLSAPFLLPGMILLGKVNLLIWGAAFILQIIVVFLLFQFVAKVYIMLILHNGNRIKPMELIRLSKAEKTGGLQS